MAIKLLFTLHLTFEKALVLLSVCVIAKAENLILLSFLVVVVVESLFESTRISLITSRGGGGLKNIESITPLLSCCQESNCENKSRRAIAVRTPFIFNKLTGAAEVATEVVIMS